VPTAAGAAHNHRAAVPPHAYAAVAALVPPAAAPVVAPPAVVATLIHAGCGPGGRGGRGKGSERFLTGHGGHCVKIVYIDVNLLFRTSNNHVLMNYNTQNKIIDAINEILASHLCLMEVMI
jgi:hypothetical protein